MGASDIRVKAMVLLLLLPCSVSTCTGYVVFSAIELLSNASGLTTMWIALADQDSTGTARPPMVT